MWPRTWISAGVSSTTNTMGFDCLASAAPDPRLIGVEHYPTRIAATNHHAGSLTAEKHDPYARRAARLVFVSGRGPRVGEAGSEDDGFRARKIRRQLAPQPDRCGLRHRLHGAGELSRQCLFRLLQTVGARAGHHAAARGVATDRSAPAEHRS